MILVSGTVSEEQAVKCLQIGATDYVGKPYDRTQVVSRALALARRYDGGTPAPARAIVLVIDDSLTFREELSRVVRDLISDDLFFNGPRAYPVEFCFPHYFLLPMFGNMSSYRIRPLGPEKCLFELYSLILPAAIDADPAPEWTFWPTGTCEPATITYKGPAGSWEVRYAPLSARATIRSFLAK